MVSDTPHQPSTFAGSATSVRYLVATTRPAPVLGKKMQMVNPSYIARNQK